HCRKRRGQPQEEEGAGLGGRGGAVSPLVAPPPGGPRVNRQLRRTKGPSTTKRSHKKRTHPGRSMFHLPPGRTGRPRPAVCYLAPSRPARPAAPFPSAPPGLAESLRKGRVPLEPQKCSPERFGNGAAEPPTSGLASSPPLRATPASALRPDDTRPA